MLERIIITLILILIGSGVYLAFKRRHVGRLGRVETVGSAQPTVLYFGSDHCAACPAQARYLQQLADQWRDRVTIRKIDAELETDKATRYGVFTLPTTILVDGSGAVREVNYGLTPAQKLSEQVARL